MATKNYFIHINSESLPHYIVSGCIKPTILIENREKDIQSEFPNHILLSSKKWSEHTDSSIEVVISDREEYLISPISEFAFYCSIIPISRIKGVYFSNKERAENVIWNIQNGDGFIPQHLIHFHAKDKNDLCSVKGVKLEQPPTNLDQLKKKIQGYNRLLGGLSFLRVALYNFFDKNLNYPVNYASTVSFFNYRVDKGMIEAKMKANNHLHRILNKDAAIFKYLAKPVNKEILENIARKENIHLEEKFSTYKLDNLPQKSLTYKLAVLYTYGSSGSKSTEDMIGSLITKLDFLRKEELALIYGISTGYESLRNYYKINNRNVNVKFDLESELDYEIIESVFNYAFNGDSVTESVNYLNEIINQLPKSNNKSLKEYTIYTIANTQFVTKPKDYSEHLESIIEAFLGEIANWFPFRLSNSQLENLSEKVNKAIAFKFKDAINDVKRDVENELKSEKIVTKIKEEKKKIQVTEPKPIEKFEEKPVEYELTIDNKTQSDNESTSIHTEAKLKKMSAKDLKKYAKGMGLQGTSKMKKNDLIELIIKTDSSSNRLFS